MTTAPRRTAEFVAQVHALRAGGARVKAIAAAMGCAYNTVRITLADGVAVDNRAAPETIQSIRRLRASRCSQREIMQELGVPLSTVARHCKRFDEEIRDMRDQRAAASAAHREGGAATPAAAAALPPNSTARMEASLRMKGMGPEAARETAKAWAARHARQNGGSRP